MQSETRSFTFRPNKTELCKGIRDMPTLLETGIPNCTLNLFSHAFINFLSQSLATLAQTSNRPNPLIIHNLVCINISSGCRPDNRPLIPGPRRLRLPSRDLRPRGAAEARPDPAGPPQDPAVVEEERPLRPLFAHGLPQRDLDRDLFLLQRPGVLGRGVGRRL